MNQVFIDTGYLIALELSNDQHHRVAVQHWSTVKRSLPQLVTTSYVFDEVVTFLNSRGHHEKAVEIGRRLLSSPSVEMVAVDEELFFAGWESFQKYRDKEYSLTDCISFLVMERRSISVAFAFDNHFEQAGFERQPEKS